MKPSALQHDNISPTAKLVAYWRQFSDIPFSKDVASLFNAEGVYREMLNGESVHLQQNDVVVPFLEIRYKSIRHLIENRKIKQVLEFASGISLRGLAMTDDPDLTYVETDLPKLTQEKVKLVQTIMDRHDIRNRQKLFFHNTNILNYNDIEPALKHFDRKKPLAIVHEGLFQYLTRAEKAIAAKNIHHVLTKFGGIWLTPDLDTKSQLNHYAFDRAQFQKFVDIIEQTTGRHLEHNAFEDDTDIFAFFHDLGFNVEFKPQMNKEISLSSLSTKPISPDLLRSLQSLRLWVLTVK